MASISCITWRCLGFAFSFVNNILQVSLLPAVLSFVLENSFDF